MIDFNDKKRPELVQEVLKKVKEHDVKFFQLHFLDMNGILKSFGKSEAMLEDMLAQGEGFDGSSVSGYGRVEESDMVAVPDPSTFAIIPWRKKDYSVARFLCDLYNPDGKRYSGDPRYILQRAMKKAEDMGFEMQAAPELEFFLLKKDGQGVPMETDLRGYFDLDASEVDQHLRREIALYGEKFPFIQVETVHHEVARSQHEVDIKYNEVGKIADATLTMKMIVKSVAANYGFLATFMPKPWSGHNGSGMHVHQSLWKKGKNAFFDENDPNKISDTLRYWIGGQLTYAKEMTAILNSWPNSYKRIVPGYEAPTYISWGFKNRSMLIRVPNFFNKANAARCEIRSPDPAGNIYLQLAALLTTGLEGIKNKIQPPAPTELNVFHVPDEEKQRMGIENLPESMGQALHAFKRSKLMEEMMGLAAYKAYIDNKQAEYNFYNSHVSEWELSRYSSVL
jgi:glutamine synthetase